MTTIGEFALGVMVFLWGFVAGRLTQKGVEATTEISKELFQIGNELHSLTKEIKEHNTGKYIAAPNRRR